MASIVRIGSDELLRELDRLEREHRMSSSEFFARFHAGKVPEGPDVMRWAWLCTVAMRRGLLSLSPAYA
jgi:hypothetical protein